MLTVLVVKFPGACVSKANKLHTLNVGYLCQQYPNKPVRKQQKTSMGADPRGEWMNGNLSPVSMDKVRASEFTGKRERDRETERERGRQTDRQTDGSHTGTFTHSNDQTQFPWKLNEITVFILIISLSKSTGFVIFHSTSLKGVT